MGSLGIPLSCRIKWILNDHHHFSCGDCSTRDWKPTTSIHIQALWVYQCDWAGHFHKYWLSGQLRSIFLLRWCFNPLRDSTISSATPDYMVCLPRRRVKLCYCVRFTKKQTCWSKSPGPGSRIGLGLKFTLFKIRLMFPIFKFNKNIYYDRSPVHSLWKLLLLYFSILKLPGRRSLSSQIIWITQGQFLNSLRSWLLRNVASIKSIIYEYSLYKFKGVLGEAF